MHVESSTRAETDKVSFGCGIGEPEIVGKHADFYVIGVLLREHHRDCHKQGRQEKSEITFHDSLLKISFCPRTLLPQHERTSGGEYIGRSQYRCLPTRTGWTKSQGKSVAKRNGADTNPRRCVR